LPLLYSLLLTVIAVLVLSGLAAAVLCAAAYFSGGGLPRLKRVALWSVLAVPLAMGYLIASLVTYGVWCESVRGVDPGIADYWLIPLQDGFSLTSIGALDRAGIYARHSTEGEALLANITLIGQRQGYVYGLVLEQDAFILHTLSGAIDRLPVVQLPLALQRYGVQGQFELLPVKQFYLARRYGWLDALAAIALGAPLLLVGLWSLRRVWRGPWSRREGAGLKVS
jgi:hypothetical protein